MPSQNFHAATEETTSGISASLGSDNIIVGMFVNVIAASGVLPTLVVQLQHSPNGTDWYNVSGMVSGSLGTISLTDIIPSNTPQYVADAIRIVWTIGGISPHFTFTVDVESTT